MNNSRRLADNFAGDGEAGATSSSMSTINPYDLTMVVLKRKHWVIRTVAAAMILAAVVVLLIPNTYRSACTILPSGKTDKMGDLKSLAGLAGFMPQDETSSELYPSILTSNTIIDAVLDRTYEIEHDGDILTIALPEYFDLTDRTKLRGALLDITASHQDKRTGIITLTAETEYPALSQAILEQYLAELETFNLYKRVTRAREDVRYLERERESREAELAVVEDSLEAFQKVNRNWASTTDPEITKGLMQLKRDIEAKSQAYLFVLQQYEVAKLDEQKDVPIVSVLDKPSLPTLKSAPRRTATVLLAGILAFMFSVLLTIVAEAVSRRTSGPDRVHYESLRQQFIESFPRSTRVLKIVRREHRQSEAPTRETVEV